ncbi:hypothetical protein WA158_000049 [Blastocystis sp. Blastoise]
MKTECASFCFQSIQASTVLLTYKYFCQSRYSGLWTIYGIVNGQIEIGLEADCYQSVSGQGSLSVNSTVDMIYYANYTSRSSTYTSISIYDEFNTLVFKEVGSLSDTPHYTFSLFHPLNKAISSKYKEGDLSSDWYTKAYDDSTWNTITSGSEISNPSSSVQQYRYTFSMNDIEHIAAYTLAVRTNGHVMAYMNDILIFNNDIIDLVEEEEEYAKIILSGYTLSLSNILSIQVTPLTTLSTHYLNLYLSLFYTNNDNKCAYTLDTYTFEGFPSATSGEHLFDYTSLGWDSSTTTNTGVSIYLLNQYYITINQYTMISNTYPDANPLTFTFLGRNTNASDWTTIDYRDTDTILLKNRTFPIDSNVLPYRQIQFKSIINSGRSNTMLSGIYIATCNQIPLSFLYAQTYYHTYKHIQTLPITPSFHGYSDISITPSLPEGLLLNSKTGRITGIPLSIHDITNYTLTASTPSPIAITLSIDVIQDCASHLKIVRSFPLSNYIYAESFSIKDKTTNQYIITQYPYTTQRSNSTQYYDYCVPDLMYQLELNDYEDKEELKWVPNSSISLYMAKDTTIHTDPLETIDNYILLYKGRFNQYGLNTIDFSFQYIMEYNTEWKHSIGQLDPNWYINSYDDSHWTKTQLNIDISNEIHLFRNTVSIDRDLTTKGSFEVYIQYQSGLLIYINEQLVFTHNMKSNSIFSFYSSLTPSDITTVTESYESIQPRRILLPMSCLHKGSNTIAIGLFPDISTSSSLIQQHYIFNMIWKYLENMETRICLSPSVDPLYINAIDMNYDTSVMISSSTNTIIQLNTTNDEYSQITHYALFSPYNRASDSRPISWTLQARDSNKENTWNTLDVRKNVRWDNTVQRRVFFINPSPTGIYNQYRFVNFHSLSTEYVYIYEIELYSSPLLGPYPSFSYTPSTTTYYVGQYISKQYPSNSMYYHNWRITPDIPTGMTFDNSNGVFYGRMEVMPLTTVYTVTATSADGMDHTSNIQLSFEECIGEKSMVTLKLFYNNKKRNIRFGMKNGIDTTGQNVWEAYSIKNPYDEPIDDSDDYLTAYYPTCLPHGYYTLFFTVSDVEVLHSPSGYSLYNDAKTILYSGSIDTNNKELTLSFNTYMPFQKYNSIWKYQEANSIIENWTDKHYSVETWKQTKGGIIKGNQNKYIHLRQNFDINDFSQSSSVDFRFVTMGSVHVYINSRMVYSYNCTESEQNKEKEHFFTVRLQNNAIKQKNNIVGILLYTSTFFLDTYFNLDCTLNYNPSTRYLNTFNVTTEGDINPLYPIQNLFDYDYFTYTTFLSNSIRLNIHYITNTPSLFNSIYIQFYNETKNLSLELYGKQQEDFNWISIQNYTFIQSQVGSIYIDTPKGILSFPYLQIRFTSTSESPLYLSEFSFAYTQYLNSICPPENKYPAVGEWEYSYTLCDEDYQGYKSRECDGLELQEEINNCVLLLPFDLYYPQQQYQYALYDIVHEITPTFKHIITEFSIQPSLPEGLHLNIQTGSISGIPLVTTNGTQLYTVTGSNPTGSITTTLFMTVTNGYCYAEGLYTITPLYSQGSIPCGDGFIGEKHRPCDLDIYNHVTWGVEDDNECVSILTLVFASSSIILVIVLIIVCYLSYRINKQTKEELRKIKSPDHLLRERSSSSKTPIITI